MWQDFWYQFKNYHAIYFQNILIREFINFLLIIGLSTVSSLGLNVKKKTKLFISKFNNINYYSDKLKTDFNMALFNKEFIRPLQGTFFSKLHILKLSNWIILCGNGYRWQKKRKEKIYRAERRLWLFYSCIMNFYKKENKLINLLLEYINYFLNNFIYNYLSFSHFFFIFFFICMLFYLFEHEQLVQDLD